MQKKRNKMLKNPSTWCVFVCCSVFFSWLEIDWRKQMDGYRGALVSCMITQDIKTSTVHFCSHPPWGLPTHLDGCTVHSKVVGVQSCLTCSRCLKLSSELLFLWVQASIEVNLSFLLVCHYPLLLCHKNYDIVHPSQMIIYQNRYFF